MHVDLPLPLCRIYIHGCEYDIVMEERGYGRQFHLFPLCFFFAVMCFVVCPSFFSPYLHVHCHTCFFGLADCSSLSLSVVAGWLCYSCVGHASRTSMPDCVPCRFQQDCCSYESDREAVYVLALLPSRRKKSQVVTPVLVSILLGFKKLLQPVASYYDLICRHMSITVRSKQNVVLSG